MDVTDIRPGQRWPREIEEAILGCRVMLVIIGPYWVAAQDHASGSRRLDDTGDWVRQEVEAGLARPSWPSSRSWLMARLCRRTMTSRRAFNR